MNLKTFKKRLVNGRYNQANFQVVVLCKLSQVANATKEEIIESLKAKNPQLVKQGYDFRSCPVWRVLTDHKHMINKSKSGYSLNVEALTNTNRKELMTICKTLLN